MSAYDKWLKKCLGKFNKKFNEKRKFVENEDNTHPHSEVVLFDDEGNAFTYDPESGTKEYGNVYAPWMESKEYFQSIGG